MVRVSWLIGYRPFQPAIIQASLSPPRPAGRAYSAPEDLVVASREGISVEKRKAGKGKGRKRKNRLFPMSTMG